MQPTHLNKLCAFLILALLASPACAQGVKLARLEIASNAQAPKDLMLPPSEAGQGEAQPENAAILVANAPMISLDTIGLPPPSGENLIPLNAWDGNDFARVNTLLARLPEEIPSQTLRGLLVKLLLANTTPPKADNIQQNSFAGRIRALFSLGEVSGASELLGRVPNNSATETTTQLGLMTYLLQNDTNSACQGIAAAMQRYPSSSTNWQKYSLFCLAVRHNPAVVQLALDALDEQHITLDHAFVAMVETMAGLRKRLDIRLQAPVALEDAAMAVISKADVLPVGYAQTAPLSIRTLMGQKADVAPNPHENLFVSQLSTDKTQPFDFDIALQKALRDYQGAITPAQSEHIAYRLYIMLKALDYKDIKAKDTHDSITQSAAMIVVSPALRDAALRAVANRHLGEALILSGVILGQAPSLANLDDGAIADVVSALRELGYVREAQSLAAEAMASLYP